jgi:hypothetical protein
METQNNVDLSSLTMGDKVLGGAGVVFLISTFLSWFSVKVEGLGSLGGAAAGSGWDVGFLWGRLPFFIVLAMLVWAGLRTFAKGVTLPAEVPALYLVGGGLSALLVLLKFLIGEDDGDLPGISINRSFGLFLAVLSVLGVAFGAFLKFTEAGGKLDQVQGQLKQVGGQVTSAATAATKSAVDTAKEAGQRASSPTPPSPSDHMPTDPTGPSDRPPSMPS